MSSTEELQLIYNLHFFVLSRSTWRNPMKSKKRENLHRKTDDPTVDFLVVRHDQSIWRLITDTSAHEGSQRWPHWTHVVLQSTPHHDVVVLHHAQCFSTTLSFKCNSALVLIDLWPVDFKLGLVGVILGAIPPKNSPKNILSFFRNSNPFFKEAVSFKNYPDNFTNPRTEKPNCSPMIKTLQSAEDVSWRGRV